MTETVWLCSCLHLGRFTLLWHCKGGMNYTATRKPARVILWVWRKWNFRLICLSVNEHQLGSSTWLDWVNNEGCVWMSHPSPFSCCVAEVGPLWRCTKIIAVGLQSTVLVTERPRWALLKNVSQQANGWVMTGKNILFVLFVLCCSAWGENGEKKKIIPWERKKTNFPCFSVGTLMVCCSGADGTLD